MERIWRNGREAEQCCKDKGGLLLIPAEKPLSAEYYAVINDEVVIK